MQTAIPPDEHGKANDQSLQTRAVKGAGVSVFAQLMSFAIQTASVVVLARLLSPKDYGLVTMVTAFSMLLMNVSVNGFPEFIIQKKTISHTELTSVFWFNVIISLFLTIGFVAAGPLLTSFYGNPEINILAAALSVSIILQAISTTHIALLNRSMEYSKVAVNQLASDFISVVFAILLALMGYGYWAIVGRQLMSPFIMAIGGWTLCRWRPGKPGQSEFAFDSVRFALRVYGNFAVGYLGRNLDKVLLGRYHGSAALGNYDRAYYLSSMPATQLVTPLHNVALATLSRMRDDAERFTRYYLSAISTIGYLGVLAGLVLTLSGKEIIYIVLGPGWEEAGRVVTAFGPGVGAMIIYATHSWIHLSLAKPERWLRWSIAACILTVILFVLAAPRGPVVLATAYSLSYYVLLVPAIWYAGRPIGLKLDRIFSAIWHYFAAAVVTWLILAGFHVYSPDTASYFESLHPAERLGAIIPLTSAIYVLLVASLQRNLSSIRNLVFYARTMLSKGKKNELV
ncbi:MAG: polysaccharide biosynthesis protein [Geobacteraceae bacterium]|jgi:PST family polysaccharide transporter|nr:polysaccharide biosynthesis protein [Geobacteraceae bacterium]